MLKGKYGKILAAGLTALTALSLAACGGSGDGGGVSGKEFVYVPEYISIGGEDEDENSSMSGFTYAGGKLYYDVRGYDEANSAAFSRLMAYDLETGAEEEIKLSGYDEENSYRQGMFVDEDGSLYFLLQGEYHYDEANPDNSYQESAISKYDASGNCLFTQDITEDMRTAGNRGYVRYIAVDGQGRMYLVSDERIGLYDSQGKSAGNIDMEGNNYIGSAFRGKDGKVYIAYENYSGAEPEFVAVEVDFDGKKLGTSYKLPGGSGNPSVSAGLEKDFLINDDGRLYEYDAATGQSEELLSWMDCDINADYVEMVCAGEDGRLLVLIRDWGTGATEFARLTRTKASDVVQKEEIVVGTLNMSQELQAAAVSFNKSNDKYHVTVKEYYDYNSDIEYEDAVAAMNNDITSGSCPDILALDSYELDAEMLASKGILEDLRSYLKKSDTLSEEDFVESVLRGYTYNDTLVCIPKYFSISAVAGKTSQVGDKMGWSIQDIMDFAAEHPDAELFEYASQGQILNMLMIFNQNAFIDWKSGTCSFDSQEFKKILEFAAGFPAEYDWDEDRESTPTRMATGKLLLYGDSIRQCEDIQVAEAMFNEPVTYIGYPTVDGGVGCVLDGSGGYGILSGAKHKEGAWAFIESYLNSKDTIFAWGFPTVREKLEEKIAEACKVEYVYDENGEIMKDENGEPIVDGMGGFGYDDWEYTYHPCTEEEIATLWELIEVAVPMQTGNSQIMQIIEEEAEPYFKGEKSLDEVAALIQSRASMYVGENS